jgi:hypothetical protein
VLSPTDAVIADLQRSTPRLTHRLFPPYVVVSVEESAAHLRGALPRCKAGGPLGWTYKHVKAATNYGLPSMTSFEAILRLVNARVAVKLPHLDAFLDSTLIAVEKSGGRGVRPFAAGAGLGMHCHALCYGCMPRSQRLPSAPPARSGCPWWHRSCRLCFVRSFGIGFRLQLERTDYQSAFTTVSLPHVFQAGAAPAPKLLPCVQWVYSSPSRILG